MSVTEDYQGQSDDDYYDDIVDMTPEVQIPSGIGLALLIVVGIVGNTMTIVAYITDRKLWSVYNFFIFNLSINDLLLCSFSMPFYAVYTLKEFTWPFGSVFCKIWMVIDFTCCFESILLMLILSFDRLVLIVLGPRYFQKITFKAAGIAVTISWFISFLVYGPCIIGWDYWAGYSTVEPGDCDVEFAYDNTYTTTTAIIEFTLPFILLTSVNALLYYKIRRRNSKPPPLVDTKSNTSCSTTAEGDDVNKSGQGKNKVMKPTMQSREHKAAKLLASLVIVFLVCWAPYTITTIMISFCSDCVHKSLYEFFNWVLWVKSVVNPFLYAYNSVQYKDTFRKMLTCKWRTRHVYTTDARQGEQSSGQTNVS